MQSLALYYNAPDGQRPFEKIIATSRWGLLFGTCCGISEYVMRSSKATGLQGLNCVAYYAIPLTAICATYSTATYAATKLRGVDGPGNHAIGALASTCILYKWQKNPIGALVWGALSVALAASYKHAHQLDTKVWLIDVPSRTRNRGLFANHDFTWTKDIRPWKQ